jgi:AcrR family transcriptional regulator
MAATKDRIVIASAELFRRQGFGSTGLKQISAQANAPFGSLYHFFPGGKEQLGEEVIRSSGRLYLRLIADSFGTIHDLPGALRTFFAGAAEVVRSTGFADACPIATIALEVASTNETLRKATADVFESWITALTACFADAGLTLGKARDLAVHTFCALEGAFILSRSTRSVVPIILAGQMVAAEAARTATASRSSKLPKKSTREKSSRKR